MPHPTYEKLIATAFELLQVHMPEEVTLAMVLKKSGVSHGSLYHHFDDFPDLIEAALSQTFSDLVDRNITIMTQMIEKASGLEDILRGISEFNRVTQLPENRDERFKRARLLALADRNERLMSRLRVEQDRLTQGYRHLFQNAQRDGWMFSDFDPNAAAVFIQAYTFGRVIDDLASARVDQEAWNSLVMAVISRVFGVGQGGTPGRSVIEEPLVTHAGSVS